VIVGATVAVAVAMRNIILITLLSISSASFAGGIDSPVVGGTTVPVGEYPDVALVVAPMALCTGTLIAPDVVLTAGHCIDTNPKEVLIGSVDYTQQTGEVIPVKSATAYPSWDSQFDVGVLVLDHDSKAKPRPIAAACTAKQLAVGANVKLVGFGLTTAAGNGDNTKLHQATLVVSDPSCTSDPSCAAAVAPNAEFIAGGEGKDSCFGDSGGPIYLDNALIGVVSRGIGTNAKPCGGGGVYVRADRVVEWIEKTTGKSVSRSTCDAPADGPGSDEDAAAPAAGGCSTAPVSASGVAGWLVLAMVVASALVLARREA
jgi:secreted trypsin-like serine protease